MSYLQTRTDLVTSLIACRDAYNSNVQLAFENKNFDPTGLSMYWNVLLIPATSDPLGKTDADFDDRRGIFQVSVFVQSNSGNYDIEQMKAIDHIVKWFKFNSSHGIATITEQTVNNGRTQESWFVRDISINYLTFVNR